MNNPNQSILGLAEVSLRVHDLDRMRRFYEQVIGREILRENQESSGKAIFYGRKAGSVVGDALRLDLRFLSTTLNRQVKVIGFCDSWL